MEYKKTNILRLANTVFQKVQKEKLFNSQNHLLITLSGGQDSALCLLVLFILKEEPIVVLDRKKILDFSRKVQNTGRVKLTSQKFLQKNKTNLLCSKNKIGFDPLTKLPVTKYTLLWCNHFWQKETFFTMEHVSKFIFCKKYAMYFFAPVRAILSEKDARNWRHKVMQRSSLFLQPQPKECGYNFTELYYNSVSIIYSRNVTEVKKAQSDILVHNEGNAKRLQKRSLCKNFVFARISFAPPLRGECVQKRRYAKRSFARIPSFCKQSVCKSSCIPSLCKTKFCKHALAMQKRSFCAHPLDQLLHPQWIKQGNALDILPRPEQLCVQGHTKSDRAESILFNLIKGTGMNGISTLQCKHTFLSNSNTLFYPIVFDFFKTIRIVCLQSHIFKRKKRINTSTSPFVMMTVLKQNFVLLRFLNTTSFWKNSVKYKMRKYSNKLKSNLFRQDSHVKTLYYQLKYKTKKL